ncbi:MAG: OmpA family protein [Deltaproteobacteria bacterium]|nr:OmpA family protein [Deltaproteobacteria bacterium]MDQ3296482.1 OmpA family protein [Myxococcota bacterium]
MRALIAILIASSGCAALTPAEKMDQFPVMDIKATRPPPGPDKIILTPSNIAIIDKIQFEIGKADLKPISFPILDEVVQVMKDNKQIELVTVEGHTDSTGSAELNRTLSQGRAESVVKYIASKGIKKDRMDPKGFGPDRPIADNATEEGREANRRVEFNIAKQGPIKTTVKDE